VIGFALNVAWDGQHQDRDAFKSFKAGRPDCTTSRMYGGQPLLPCRADRQQPEDVETVIDGLESRV